MPWTDDDDANWSRFAIESINYLDGKGATKCGRQMFHDLLCGGRARVFAHGFDAGALDRSIRNARRFIDYSDNNAEGDDIAPDHLDASLRSLCPIFPIC